MSFYTPSAMYMTNFIVQHSIPNQTTESPSHQTLPYNSGFFYSDKLLAEAEDKIGISAKNVIC